MQSQGLVDRLLRSVTQRPWWALAAVFVVTLLALTRIVDPGSGQPRLLLDPSINSMLPREDPSRDFYNRVRELFGSDETVLVVLSDDDIFTQQNLGALLRMSERMEQVDGVHHVTSLANSLNIRSVDGDLEVDPFLEVVPADPAELARIRREALGSPVYSGNLISPDGQAAMLLVYLFDIPEAEFIARGIDDQLAAIAREEAGDATVWISGGAHVKAEMSRMLMADLSLVLPLAVALMAGVAFVCFRTLRGVLVPLSTILISLLWTLAGIAMLAGSLNQVTVAVPPIILVVGFAYAVHVVSAYYDALRGELGPPDPHGPAFRAARHVFLPVVLTGATTAAGFVALATSRLAAIQEFGVFCALGVLCATVVSLVYAPALLQLLPARPPRQRAAENGFDRFLERLAHFDVRRRGWILAAGALVAVLSLYGMTRIQVSTDMVRNFPADNPVRLDFDAINERLEGSNSLYVVAEADTPDAFIEPANLRQLLEVQDWLEAQPEIGGTTSFADYLRVINRAFHDDDPAALQIPESRELIAQLLLFSSDPEFENFVDSSYETANVVVRAKVIDSGLVAELTRRIEAQLATLAGEIRYTVTGNAVLVSRTIDDIALGQALSLGTAFAIIFAILVLLFTSFRIGLIALIPNVLPVLVYFGLLGFSGITLNIVTGLIACLVLGIAVDDTIHFLAHFNRASKNLADENRGVVEALRHVGRPVTYTTAALCIGFLTLTLSELRTQVEFGALASITLAVAWLIDVTFTPALAARLRIVTLWDVITLDLGDDPRRSIPLFAGLRDTQARVIALMSSLRSFPKGHKLFVAGESGDEMYVVIDGELRVSLLTDQGEVRFDSCVRGDAVGEVALFHGVRTADVEAASDVRLLRLTHASLERIRGRYPRTGAQLYRNLAQILANRVASTTAKL